MQNKAPKKIAAKRSTRYEASSASRHRISVSLKAEKLKDVLLIAEESGLFRGARTKVVRGRMPEAVVTKAKARTGISSDTDLIGTPPSC
jgi:hypothetical protein